MALFVDPSGYARHNHGDTAMLLVALKRLTRLFPRETILLMNRDERFFREHYPAVRCIRPEDRHAFFQSMVPRRLTNRLLPVSLASKVHEAERRYAVGRPKFWSKAAVMKSRAAGSAGNAERYLRALLDSRALVITGGGAINDAFLEHALTTMDEIEIASRSEIPVYVFGQGIGPIDNPLLLRRVREALPLATRIWLREGKTSPQLLEQLDVPRERFDVTGDDAIEIVFPHAPPRLSNGLGVNFRIASYSNLNDSIAATLGQAVRTALSELDASFHPVPISRRSGEDDLVWSYRMVMGADPPPEVSARFETPEAVIEEAAKCRTVVTASYHGAVFALAQGIPVIGLSRSPYYDDKFNGLAHQFGGCEVARISDRFTAEDLLVPLRRMWARAEELRPRLLEAAERQRTLSRGAYERMAADLDNEYSPGRDELSRV